MNDSMESVTAIDLSLGDFFVRGDHDSGVVYRVVSGVYSFGGQYAVPRVDVEVWGLRTDGRVQSAYARADRPVRRLEDSEVPGLFAAMRRRVRLRGVTVPDWHVGGDGSVVA